MQKFFTLTFLVFLGILTKSFGQLYSSSNASAAARSVDYPVDLSSGTASISLPIYSFNSGNLSLPLSLSYGAKTLNKEDKASWVGLGWFLNGGGVITRSLQGIPDEQDNWNVNSFNENDCLQKTQVVNGIKDTQPDIFYFSFQGRSGKFVMKGDQAFLYPHQTLSIKIIPGEDLTFMITDEAGISYYFGDQASERTNITYKRSDAITSNVYGASPVYPELAKPLSYNSSFHLFKIVAPNGDQIDLSYDFYSTTSKVTIPVLQSYTAVSVSDALNYANISGSYLKSQARGGGGTTTSQTVEVVYNDTVTVSIPNARTLKEITGKNGKIVFQTSARTDEVKERKLDRIQIFREITNPVLFREYVLEYSYRLPKDCTNKDSDGKLFLERLKERSFSESQQTWEEKIPYQLNYWACDTESDQELAKFYSTAVEGTLKQIKYLNGTVSTFGFEQHTYRAVSSSASIANVLYLTEVKLNTADSTSSRSKGCFQNLFLDSKKDSIRLVVDFMSHSGISFIDTSANAILFRRGSYIKIKNVRTKQVLLSKSLDSLINDYGDLPNGMVKKMEIPIDIPKGETYEVEAEVKGIGRMRVSIVPSNHSLYGSRGLSLGVDTFQNTLFENGETKLYVAFGEVPPATVPVTKPPTIPPPPPSITDNSANAWLYGTSFINIRNIRTNELVFSKTASEMMPSNKDLTKPVAFAVKIEKGETYRVESEVKGIGRLNFAITKKPTTSIVSSQITDGLRIKTVILQQEGDNKKLSKNYYYHSISEGNSSVGTIYSVSGRTSGVLYNEQSVNTVSKTFVNKKLSSYSYPMNDYLFSISETRPFVFGMDNGYRINYENVTVEVPGVSKTEYKFSTGGDFRPKRSEVSQVINKDWANGQMLWKKEYVMDECCYVLVQEQKNSYSERYFNQDINYSRVTSKIANYASLPPPINTICNIPSYTNNTVTNLFLVEPRTIKIGTVQLDSTTTIQYQLGGESSKYLKTSTRFFYPTHTRHTAPTRTETINSEGEKVVTYQSYLADFANGVADGGVAFVAQRRNMVMMPLESRVEKVKNGQTFLLSASLNSYKLNEGGSNQLPQIVADKQYSIFLKEPLNITSNPQAFRTATFDENSITTKDNRYEPISHTDVYDVKGNLLQSHPENGVYSSLIYDYNNSRVVAKVSNAKYSDIAYTGFEADSKGNWSYTASAVNTPYTGAKGYLLANGAISKTIDPTQTYKVSFWAKGNGGITINSVNKAINGTEWRYFEQLVTGQASVVLSASSATVVIDELRLHPVMALMETYTYEHALGNLTTTTDANQYKNTQEFDIWGRVVAVRNKKGDMMEAYKYIEKTPTQYAYTDKWTALQPNIKTVAEMENCLACKQQVRTYSDAYGRTVQQVTKQGSPDQKDVVQVVVYDALGGTPKQYLPYVANSNTGEYRPNALQEQALFYAGTSTAGSPDGWDKTRKIATTQYPFSETPYFKDIFSNGVGQYDYITTGTPFNNGQEGEKSFYQENAAPGQAWQLNKNTSNQTTGAGKTIKSRFYVNQKIKIIVSGNDAPSARTDLVPVTFAYDSTTLNLKKYSYNPTTQTLTSLGLYPLGEISISEVVDEHIRKVHTFSNRSGQVLLQRVYAKNDDKNYKDTYTLYDDFGRVTLVIPPLASEMLASGTSFSAFVFEQYCFGYVYDAYGRVISKKLPAAAWEYYVYRKNGALALSQDGNQRNKSIPEWSFSKVDVLGRTVLQGMIQDGRSREALQAVANTMTSFYETKNASNTDVKAHLYSNVSFPVLDFSSTTATTVLNVSYYDDYAGFSSNYVATNAGFEAIPIFERLQGTATASKTLHENGSYLNRLYLYDADGRLVQNQADNTVNGKDIVTNLYDWKGTVLQEYSVHTSLLAGMSREVKIKNFYSYDVLGRLLSKSQQLNNQPLEALFLLSYNTLGQVVWKRLGNNLQKLDYRYNIRGWMTHLNDADLSNEGEQGEPADIFGMEYSYNNAEVLGYANSENQYNGNISGIRFKSSLDNKLRTFVYRYDAHDQLGSGILYEGNSAISAESVSYDKNGNIKQLIRSGLLPNKSIGGIDNLAYSYSGNQLLSVSDGITGDFGFKDGNTTGNDYSYDVCGNLVSDKNKGILSITYNTSHQPVEMLFADRGTVQGVRVSYGYVGGSVKASKRVYENNLLKTETLYAGAFVYEQNKLSFINLTEGRAVLKSDGSFGYEYQLSDHQGNLRVSFSKSENRAYTATMEENGSGFENYAATRSPEQAQSGAFGCKTSVSQRLGVSKSFVVSQGDSVYLNVDAFYNATASQNSQIFSLMPTLTPVSGGGEGSSPTWALGLSATSNNLSTAQDGLPKAYLQWILYDTKGNYLESGRLGVGTDARGVWRAYQSNLKVSASGILQVALVNESDVNVYFDNLFVKHVPHLILQESHYTPFGVLIDGIGKTGNNNYLYNAGTELETTTGFYDTEFRRYDAQIGIFTGIDALAEEFANFSPYVYALNNPVSFNDPSGLKAETNFKDFWSKFLKSFDSSDDGRWEFSGSDMGALYSAYSTPGAKLGYEDGEYYSYTEKVVKPKNPSITNGIRDPSKTIVTRLTPKGDNDCGCPNPPCPTKQEVAKYLPFNMSFGLGVYGGLEDTGEFLGSLGTKKGWQNLGRGMIGLAELGSPSIGTIGAKIQVATKVTNYVSNIPNMTEGEIGYDLGFGAEKVGEMLLTRKLMPAAKTGGLPKWGGNLNIGNKFQISVMSRVQAPGMSGHRVLGFKYGKFQGAIDRHNWILRKPGQTSINEKFWHYHWGKGKTGGHHMQFGTGDKILDPSQLRNGWFGDY